MDKLTPCPVCGRIPKLGYACGEFFISDTGVGCGVCDEFPEMHSSEELVVKAWNKLAHAMWKAKEDSK